MPRSNRFEAPNSIYHVMNRGLARKDFAFSSEDYVFFWKGLREISELFKIEIFAFCLMSNHYHILLRTPEANLSRAMRHFAHCFVQRLNRRMGTDGPIFKGRFTSILVAHENYLNHLVRYIHLNPVKAGIVQSPEAYPWSSAGYYSRNQFPIWFYGRIFMNSLGPDSKAAITAYKVFMGEPTPLEFESFYKRTKLGSVIDQFSLQRSADEAVRKGELLRLPGTKAT